MSIRLVGWVLAIVAVVFFSIGVYTLWGTGWALLAAGLGTAIISGGLLEVGE
jgi:hypothetical protein